MNEQQISDKIDQLLKKVGLTHKDTSLFNDICDIRYSFTFRNDLNIGLNSIEIKLDKFEKVYNEKSK